MGYSESKYLLDVSGTARSLTRDRAVFNHVVILDSQVAGHWKRTLKKQAVSIEAALYWPFDDARARALQDAADRHGAFLGLAAVVRTGPHERGMIEAERSNSLPQRAPGNPGADDGD